MALTNNQIQAILSAIAPLIAQEGSVQSVAEQITQAYADNRNQAALASIASNFTASVAAWDVLDSLMSTGFDARFATLFEKRVVAAIAAQNANDLFRNLIAYYIASRVPFVR
jgi:hypothetical protein